MTAPNDSFPDEVRLLEQTAELHITWDDGHVSPFTLAYIRGWCPCAACQGHFSDTVKYQEVPPARLVNAVPVGNYGMQLSWSDGHDTGIYAHDELRRMCTCATCDPDGAKLKERERVKGGPR